MKIVFFGDKHDTLDTQNYLLKNISKYKNYDLWLEFIYPSDTRIIKKIILESNKDKKKILYNQLLVSLSKNNWSETYNKNIILIIEKALKYNITIFGLEEYKYSLKEFVEVYNNYGIFFYLADRYSESKNGCNSRWVTKIYNNLNKTNKNQLIIAGRLHEKALDNLFYEKYKIKIKTVII